MPFLKRDIDGEPTLLGIYEQYINDLRKHWKKETAEAYDRNFRNILAPKFNDKPYAEYNKKEILEILKEIKIEGYRQNYKIKTYSDSTIDTFRANIHSIDKIAADKCIRDIPALWGTSLALSGYHIWNEENPLPFNDEEITKNNIKENTVLKKSLKIPEERRVFNLVMRNPKQTGKLMGIALMYSCGLRNAEACGVNFEDIIPIDGYENSFVLRINKTTDNSRKTTIYMKTNNAYRYIPLAEATVKLLNDRKEYVKVKLNLSDKEVNKLPVACFDNDFEKRCTNDDLTEAGRFVLYKAGVKSKTLAYIELNNSQSDMVIYEKEPTAYLLRRNFGTIMYKIDLDQYEREYVMGHAINSATMTRNRFNNRDILYMIKQKMDNRPFFTSEYNVNETKELSSETITLKKQYLQKISVHNEEIKHLVDITAKAYMPNDNIKVSVKTNSKKPIEVDVRSTVVPFDNCNNTSLSIIKLIHKRYGKLKDPEE